MIELKTRLVRARLRLCRLVADGTATRKREGDDLSDICALRTPHAGGLLGRANLRPCPLDQGHLRPIACSASDLLLFLDRLIP